MMEIVRGEEGRRIALPTPPTARPKRHRSSATDRPEWPTGAAALEQKSHSAGAVDLADGSLRWSVPLRTAEDVLPNPTSILAGSPNPADADVRNSRIKCGASHLIEFLTGLHRGVSFHLV